MNASALMGQWADTELFVAFALGVCIGAVGIAVWLLRRLAREQRRYDSELTQLNAASRAQLAALEAQGREQLAQLRQQLERLRAEHGTQMQIAQRRLEQQLLFDPHYWLAQARALRVEGRGAAGVAELYTGLNRTRAALAEALVEIALHHFVLRVGLPASAAAAHLREAERCVQLAALFEPDNRAASHVAEDIAAALGASRVDRQGSVFQEAEAAARDEALFLGRPDARKALVAKLIREARVAEAGSRFIVAQPLAQRALAIALYEAGAAAALTLEARRAYAYALIANGAYQQALEEIELALCGPEPQAEDELHAMRADVFARLGHWERALSELDALLILRENLLGSRHHETLQLRRERSLALSALGHGEVALLEIEATLESLEHTVDPDKADADDEPALTRALVARATILDGLGRSAEAFAELERVLPSVERIFGVEHPHALHVRWQRALVLHALHREEEALDDIESLLSTQAYVFGPDHPLVLQSAALRARVMRALGREQEALVEARRLLPLHVSSFGEEHGDTMRLHGLVAELEAA